jgi:hypothetical protein
MICENGFVFRKGKKDDKPPKGWITDSEEDFAGSPDFVLELHNKQVASACILGEENHIFMISSIVWNKGYGSKFIEFWEKYSRQKGYTEIVVSHVISDPLGHILEKRGFSFELDESNEKIYRKNISPIKNGR